MEKMKQGEVEHILAQSKSGTGKTMAFLSVVIMKICTMMLENSLPAKPADTGTNTHSPIVLILAPTREIAIQINDFTNLIMSGYPNSESTSLCSEPIIGGIPISETRSNLLVDKPLIVCGTLGRVLDMLERKYISLDSLQMLVFDEADQMCKKKLNEKAFGQLQKIMSYIDFGADPENPKIQVLAFSATF
jgi:superfamily II DNA/RNA helicase